MVGGEYWWKTLFRAKTCVPAPSAPTSVLTQNKGPDTEPHFSNPPPPPSAGIHVTPPPLQSNFHVAQSIKDMGITGVRESHLSRIENRGCCEHKQAKQKRQQQNVSKRLLKKFWGGGELIKLGRIGLSKNRQHCSEMQVEVRHSAVWQKCILVFSMPYLVEPQKTQ